VKKGTPCETLSHTYSASFSFLSALKQGNFVSSSLLNLHIHFGIFMVKNTKCICIAVHSENRQVYRKVQQHKTVPFKKQSSQSDGTSAVIC
jgi:hypothetical protein